MSIAGENGAGEPPVVAAAKVRVPTVAATAVLRPRLHTLMDDAVGGPPDSPLVTVVRAPAGSGKTTMLAAWARDRSGVAWVALDNEDDDPVRLWSAILRSLQIGGPWGEAGPLDGLTPPPAAEPYAGFLAAVLAALEDLPAPLVLVLDGMHEVTSDEAVHTLNILLRHLPPTLRVVLATRFPPPLILPRLKLEGRLREIDPEHLIFTTDEARSLYANEGFDLTEAELGLLMERTEGWAAGLRLAAITLAGSTRPDEVITDFTGEDRGVADYLVGEVLDRQPEDVRQFMLATCVCGRFTADLAARLSRQENAGQILDLLDRTGVLVSDRDEETRWYRYHPLLRSYLRAELGRRRKSAQRELHRIAAGAFLASGEPQRAMEHAIAAGDDDLLTRLLAKHGLELLGTGEAIRLRRILDGAPASVLTRPSVALVAAATALELGDLLAADRSLRSIDNGTHPLRTQRLRALHATIGLHRARLHGDLGAALVTLRSTRAGQTGDVDVDLMATFNRGVAAAWTGHHQTAKAELHRALQLATTERRDAITVQCQAHLAAAAATEGDLGEMTERADAAIELATARGWQDTSRCAYPSVLLGVGAYERLDDAAAVHLAERAVQLLDRPIDPTIDLFAHTLRAMVTFDTAEDPHEVAGTLRAHWQRLGGRTVAPALLAYAALPQQRMALRVGEYTWALEVLSRLENLRFPCGERELLRATLHANRGRFASARRLLQPVLDGQTRSIVASTLIDAWLLEAHLAERAADAHRSHEALVHALGLAAPHQVLRSFRDAGQSIRVLLAQGSGRFGRLEPFATNVLAAVPVSVLDATDGLTEREQALLAELPSMRTAEEIASTLFVSVNTVKTHLRGIYRKLGVSHRRDAIAVARQRGLL
ncbi:LuxR C-terminal-related transcriptional regulator [Actinophytocola sp.]|uniref:LuxR C-terminal-related transcriptional regulator n=1 Tax=Actinophytocola sp. TaxID=1872138 RepID=UPI002D7FA5FA|nr:LuxR C-terminal-related transcriptional regulator [Actinophytocola sp.]HET9144440.1 LuxR C-terminal-related transcriptional regulator [Actinophytocola sp.]